MSRGEDTVDSDIDLLVTKSAPMSSGTIARLRREVAEVLGWRVDLVFDTALKPQVEREIRSDLGTLP
ncbi:hypothetical protein ASF65_03830 [Aureimonas sp. Leaf324]|nr:hypothetical protein ASF65_03830 [Aureimonas sp. Leaf324]